LSFEQAVALACGDAPIDPADAVRQHIIDEGMPGDERRDIIDLTGRELEVLRLVAQGLTDAEVGRQLVISPRTVNGHLTSIYSKLGVSSRTAATRFAIENHLI
jgi:DNA-binding NarL/FixJ family response regulator